MKIQIKGYWSAHLRISNHPQDSLCEELEEEALRWSRKELYLVSGRVHSGITYIREGDSNYGSCLLKNGMFTQDTELDMVAHALNTALGVQEEDQELKANLGYIRIKKMETNQPTSALLINCQKEDWYSL